jgi:alpha-1,6-mannosyltransferase
MPPSPTRIVDTTLFYGPSSGGVRRYLETKHGWFSRQAGYEHTLFVPGRRDHWEPGGRCELASPALWGDGGYRMPLRLRTWTRLLRDLQPDLIEFGDPYQTAWVAKAACRAAGAACVAFCHSDLPRLLETRVGAWGGVLGRAHLRAVYDGTDLVIAPSHHVARMLERAHVERVVVQPLGVDVGLFNPSRAVADVRRRLGLPERARLLVFAGRAALEKDLPVLIETVERLGDPYWLILIGGYASARSCRRVRVLPWIADGAELAAWLASCDVFVHAGRQESFGLIALEALACGTPVACLEGGALPEIVVPSVGAVALRPGAAGLADAVAELFDRPLAATGEAARRHVLEHYRWDTVFDTLLMHYGRLLGRRRAPPMEPLPATA